MVFLKTVNRVHLNVDEERKFYNAISERLKLISHE